MLLLSHVSNKCPSTVAMVVHMAALTEICVLCVVGSSYLFHFLCCVVPGRSDIPAATTDF